MSNKKSPSEKAEQVSEVQPEHVQSAPDAPSAAAMTMNSVPHTLLYADQLSFMAVSPFTTKLTFGVVEPNNASVTTTVTIVMPTISVANMGKEIEKNLTKPEVRASMGSAFKEFLN